MNDHNPINHLCTESTEMTTHFRILLHLSAGLSTDLSSAEQSLDARGARGGGGGGRGMNKGLAAIQGPVV